jgi:hypothetical protein
MRALLCFVSILLATFLTATAQSAWADQGPTMSVSPSVVDVGLDFTGYDVHVYGTAPEGTQVVLKVDGPASSVKVSKKGKVLGLFWMTVGRAQVENMPAFHVVHSSEEIDKILSQDEQVRLGVDPMSASIVSQARAVDPNEGTAVSEDKAAEFIAGLRDMYIRDGRYVACPSCQGALPVAAASAGDTAAATAPGDNVIHLRNGRWETSVSLSWDAPLGDYTVDSYCIKDGQVVGSDSATFTVRKAGLVDSLGSMAKDSAPLYGAMSLGIIIAVGLATGFVFPRRRADH